MKLSEPWYRGAVGLLSRAGELALHGTDDFVVPLALLFLVCAWRHHILALSAVLPLSRHRSRRVSPS
ncbi:hypothetical protein ACIA59_23725 [Micromonospora haikouensis]|uniref:hypothetical protein n=1 Tax=Micromonospora haikouensis TaxID=686309 RepID=UPI0037BE0AAC